MIGLEWVLTICTAGWGLCGQIRTVEYPSEESCYRALGVLYRTQGRDAFKYITCSPKETPVHRPDATLRSRP